MPHLTSIYTDSNYKYLGDIQRDTPLFIDKPGADVTAFLEHNQSRFAETCCTFTYINNGSIPDTTVPAQLGLNSSATIAISFFGPTSGSLTLRLRHITDDPDATLVIDDLTGSHAFEFPVPSTLTVDDITLHPNPTPSSRITFERGTRNNLIIHVSSVRYISYWLRDIQLLDEEGRPYNPSSSEVPDVSPASSSRWR
jgi:hypothetical protein